MSWPPRLAPWWPYYEALFPDWEQPRTAWLEWKMRSTAVNIVQALWHARERARQDLHHDLERSRLKHPPVVLWLPFVANPACLACQWITSGPSEDLRAAAREARRHAVDNGDDVEQVDRLPVPVAERGGPIDEPLLESWL